MGQSPGQSAEGVAGRRKFRNMRFGLLSLVTRKGKELYLRALSFCQNWPARPNNLQRKCNNLKEHLHDNPSHSSRGVYIILDVC